MSDLVPPRPSEQAGVRPGETPRACLVTFADSDEALKWGLDVGRVAVPMVVLCTPDAAAAFRERGPCSALQLVTTGLAGPLTPRDNLACLRDACAARYHDADVYYWADLPLLYQHLSFEFLYSDVLLRAIAGAVPQYLGMPGYSPSSFFGGPAAVLEALGEPGEGDLSGLFESTVHGAPAPPVFRMAFGNCSDDLNLNLARAIHEPVLHVAGDSHVYNCFTLNRAIGCRANVLTRTADVSPIAVPYAYQFSHHLGGRTMHHAGAPGALLTLAEQCGVKDGDAVEWVFGEIDARCHIMKRHREDHRALDEVIETLVGRYIDAVVDVGRRYPRVRSVVFAPIPPLDNPGYQSDTLPVYGTIEERVAVTRQLRRALEKMCGRHGIGFVATPRDFETNRGDLRWDMSDHFCHVASDCQGPIVERLYTLLAGNSNAAVMSSGSTEEPPSRRPC